jgi:hypothetical protein
LVLRQAAALFLVEPWQAGYLIPCALEVWMVGGELLARRAGPGRGARRALGAVLVCCAALLRGAQGVRFDLAAGRERCVFDVLNKDQLATGEYAVVGGGDAAIELRVTGPRGEEVHSRDKASPSGLFGFAAAAAGEHRVCFKNNDKVQHRVSIQLRSGVEAKDLSEVVQRDHIKPLSAEVVRIEETVRSIRNELLALKMREQEMRSINELTNNRVFWFSLLSVFIVSTVGVWQVLHLKEYFRSKKLI